MIKELAFQFQNESEILFPFKMHIMFLAFNFKKNIAQCVQLMKKFDSKKKQNYFVSENINSLLKRNALLRLLYFKQL